MKLKTMFCSSLAKVMPLSDPEVGIRQGCALRGERFSFQLAYKLEEPGRYCLKVKTESPFGKALRVRKVGLVPVEYTGVVFDEDIISKDPGMYPDLLTGLDTGRNLDFKFHTFVFIALAVTYRTLMKDLLSASAAIRTNTGRHEDTKRCSILRLNLSCTITS